MAGEFGIAAIDDYSAYLKAYWKLEATGANNRLDSIGSNDLVPTNTPGTRAGKKNNACDFIRASTQYLSIADNPDVSPTTGFVIAGWVWFDDTGNHHIFTKPAYDFYFINNNGKISFYIKESGGTPHDLGNITPPSTGAWHHFVAMACDGVQRVFLDGVEWGSTHTYDDTISDTGNPFALGHDGLINLDGGLDEVGLWKNITFAGATERNAFVAGLWNGGSGRFWEEIISSYLTRDVGGILDRTPSGVLVRALVP